MATEPNGIDVSMWQGKIDWAKVAAAGYQNAAIKASQGLQEVDPDFVFNAQGAKAAGLHTVYYHYGNPANNPVDEANHFINTVKLAGLPDGPLVLDIETNGGLKDVSEWSVAFLDHVHEVLDHTVAWYSYESFIKNYMKAVEINYPDWIASYGTNPPSGNWLAWQMSDKGRVPGINGYVDLDNFDPQFLQIPTPLTPVPKPDFDMPYGYMSLGSVGSTVIELQQALNYVNKAALVITGRFDDATDKALRAFQKKAKIAVDGIYGPQTRAAIEEVFKA